MKELALVFLIATFGGAIGAAYSVYYAEHRPQPVDLIYVDGHACAPPCSAYVEQRPGGKKPLNVMIIHTH